MEKKTALSARSEILKEKGFEGFVKISICKTGYGMDQKSNFTGVASQLRNKKKIDFSSLFEKISFF